MSNTVQAQTQTQTLYRVSRVSRLVVVLVCLVLALLGLIVWGLLLGIPQLSLSDLLRIIQGGGTRLENIVVPQLRLPREVLGVLAGAMLALAGNLFQDSLRNALAGPELLGVSSGASFVMASIVVFHLPVPWELYPVAALAGGMLAGSVSLLSMRRLGDPIRLVLMGVSVTALLHAAIIAIISLGQENDVGLLFLYLLGSLANRTWDYVNLVWPWAVVCIPLSLLMARPLNLLQLGDEVAEGLGLRVVRWRLIIMAVGATMVASTVAVCGPIGYIALACPHMARRLLGTTDARVVLPVSMLMGSVLLVGADLLAKNLFSPLEMPVGLWTTLIGGPLLLVLIRRALAGRKTLR
ncbi:MAG TPA: iron ABC transporter permease [Chloroflexia bacterium]|nr:iron ABC transporter permease [Chloroflexia bacterium]